MQEFHKPCHGSAIKSLKLGLTANNIAQYLCSKTPRYVAITERQLVGCESIKVKLGPFRRTPLQVRKVYKTAAISCGNIGCPKINETHNIVNKFDFNQTIADF